MSDERIRLEKYEAKINEYNTKYDTKFTLKDFVELTNCRLAAMTATKFDNKTNNIASYRLSYKKLAKNLFENPLKMIREENMMEDFNILADEGLFYVGNIKEKVVSPYVEVTVKKVQNKETKENYYVTNYLPEIDKKDFNGDLIGADEYKVGLKNTTVTSMYSNSKFINSCETLQEEDGVVTKNIGILANGAMNKEEYREFVNDQFISHNALDTNNLVTEAKEDLFVKDVSHSADIINYTKSVLSDAKIAFSMTSRTKENAKAVIDKVAPYYAILKEKRESRGFFGVLFHPFKAHAETVALKEIRSKVHDTVKNSGLYAFDFDKAVEKAKNLPSSQLAMSIKDSEIDFDNNAKRADSESYVEQFIRLDKQLSRISNESFEEKIENTLEESKIVLETNEIKKEDKKPSNEIIEEEIDTSVKSN